MTVRNLESRLIKLEGRTSNAGKALLIWRRPKEAIDAAVDKARHLFGSDDRVMVAFCTAMTNRQRRHGMTARSQERLTIGRKVSSIDG